MVKKVRSIIYDKKTIDELITTLSSPRVHMSPVRFAFTMSFSPWFFSDAAEAHHSSDCGLQFIKYIPHSKWLILTVFLDSRSCTANKKNSIAHWCTLNLLEFLGSLQVVMYIVKATISFIMLSESQVTSVEIICSV